MSERNETEKRLHVPAFLLRIAAGLFLMALIWSCASVPGLQEESIVEYIRVPFVRVLLENNSDEFVLDADGSFAIECLTDGQQAVFYSSQPVTLRNEGMRITVTDNGGNRIRENVDEVNIIPRGQGKRIVLEDARYRGIIKVLPEGRQLQLVNVVYIEDYLKGVVPPEIGPREENEIEAVKAQAVAARTYTMSHLKQYGEAPYDMRSTIADQLYHGVNVEDPLVNRAIDATEGDVIMYGDDFITAYYHSTCGGMTDDIGDVWGRTEVPYLRPVVDSACLWSKYFHWQEIFTEPQLRGRIEQYLSTDRGRPIKLSPITDVVISGTSAGGRVMKMEVVTQNDSYRFFKDRIRWVVGRSSNPDLILPSDRFKVKISRDGSGRVVAITFDGSGYGHGVGMCQCGAIGKAREGWAFNDILGYFYTDVEIKQLY